MAPQSQFPNRLASEEVIINAPLSYAGSAQRIIRIRRRAPAGWQLGALTLLAIVLVALVWVFVTAWYLTWGLFLVPYRLLRPGSTEAQRRCAAPSRAAGHHSRPGCSIGRGDRRRQHRVLCAGREWRPSCGFAERARRGRRSRTDH